MTLRVAGAQLNLHVGDIAGNEKAILSAMDRALEHRADILLTPELALTGYPPEDLVNRDDFVDENLAALSRIASLSGTTTVVVGFVDRVDPSHSGAVDSVERSVSNAAAIVREGKVQGVYHKVLLPNYGVFDEDRNFAPGLDPSMVWEVAGRRVGVSVCEDMWLPDGPPMAQAMAGAELLVNINASPYHRGKAAAREAMLAERSRAAGVPVVYLNLVGGQDELVFEGGSVVIDGQGSVFHRSPQFEEDFFVVDVELGGHHPAAGPRRLPEKREGSSTDRREGRLVPLLDPVEEVYRALTTGLKDYVTKNRFDSALVMLSGGLDSALTAAVAVDALGSDRVWGVGLPTRYSSEHSVDDARALARNLGIRFDLIAIDEIFQSYLDALGGLFTGTPTGVTEENLQARVRGAVAMALSNKFGHMVIATGNKSEMATGYATLYGDMVGGYAVLKDVFKTLAYDLARWRNREGEVIPQNTIDKPPSAELRPEQLDSDSLPPYDILDAILERYIEGDMSIGEIVADGFSADIVVRVARMVDAAEFKRRQAAPGVKITSKAFGRDRRLPITNAFRPGG